MKSTKFLAAAAVLVVLTVFLSACGESRSKTKMQKEKIQKEPTIVHDSVPVSEEKPKDKNFEFWVKKIEVSPLRIDPNGTYGEGELPAKELTYEIFFIDSLGGEKYFKASAYKLTNKPLTKEDEKWYESLGKDFDHLNNLYLEVVNAPEGRIFVSGRGDEVLTIKKGVDLQNKKVGNATIRESSTIDLH